MRKFAKVYDSEALGQILVLRNYEEDNPQIDIMTFVEEVGMATLSIDFTGEDADAAAERALTNFTAELAERMVETGIMEPLRKGGAK